MKYNNNYSENSRFAYQEIQGVIPDCQSDILATFILWKERGKDGLTAKEVSKYSGHPINTVVARINELMYDKQALKIQKVVINGKRPANFYSLREITDPVNERKLSWMEKFKKLEGIINAVGDRFLISNIEIIKKS